MQQHEYEQKLITGWEEVFKKGQLTMWLLLALKDGPKHMAEMKQFISAATNGVVTADDQSLYRALRRYYEAELVDFSLQPGEGGPDRKVYTLTTIGRRLLDAFTRRNIIDVFYRPDIKQLLKA